MILVGFYFLSICHSYSLILPIPKWVSSFVRWTCLSYFINLNGKTEKRKGKVWLKNYLLSDTDNCCLKRIAKPKLFKSLLGIYKVWTVTLLFTHSTWHQPSNLVILLNHSWTTDQIRTGLLLSPLLRRFIKKSRPRCQEEEWSGTEWTLLEVQCDISTVSNDLRSHVIYWCWSTVFIKV